MYSKAIVVRCYAGGKGIKAEGIFAFSCSSWSKERSGSPRVEKVRKVLATEGSKQEVLVAG